MSDQQPSTSKQTRATTQRQNGAADNVLADDTAISPAEFSGTDLVVGYPGNDEPVIDGESVTVSPGEVTALIGPNGSGKSTLLKGLADKITPESGTVLLDGDVIDSLGSKELARKLGILSQQNVAPAGISVEDLVERGRYPYCGFFESLTDDDRAAVEEAIELAGVEHLRDREVGSLSGGQKQLVWIAMALAQNTDVVLLDEPTTFLDPHHQLEVMEIVEALRDENNITVVVVLHDIVQAARHADYIVALRDGSVYDCGPPEQIITEQLLAEVFEIEAVVTETERGLQVEPLEPINEPVSRDEEGTG
ncbi:ABC transporter ATP-binding protein [Halovenus rubra]|uniref:Cobalamin import ATP-binding protein BtuD n=2 Tax=Halovenus rubra TaxID=869890 RepID=A0ABD5X6C3_9EURY|nr:ABC transporter ATP-binding protein [Halovenus rubra]